MKCTYESMEEHYGCGLPPVTMRWFAELEEDDEPEIRVQIEEWLVGNGELPTGEITISLFSEEADAYFDFEIDPFEFLSEAQMEEVLSSLDV